MDKSLCSGDKGRIMMRLETTISLSVKLYLAERDVRVTKVVYPKSLVQTMM